MATVGVDCYKFDMRGRQMLIIVKEQTCEKEEKKMLTRKGYEMEPGV